MKRWIRVVRLTLCLSGAACHSSRTGKSSLPSPQTKFRYDADSVCTDSSPRWLPVNRASDYFTEPTKVGRSPREWAYFARHVPGGWAGGPFYPWPGLAATRTIFLRDTTLKDAALAALDTLVPANARRPSIDTPVAVRQARWDIAELYDWNEFIAANFARAKGVEISRWGIGREGLTIGIVSRGMLLATVEWLHELNVPCGLVTVEVLGRVKATHASRKLPIEIRSLPSTSRPR
jgi:hypothetical protein